MAGQTILVVDENETSRIFLAMTLRRKSYKALEASSAKEALVFAWRDHPDLILFDPVLPDIQPVEFIQKLRHDSRTADTPLLALSRNADPALKAACLDAGVTEYLIKSTVALQA